MVGVGHGIVVEVSDYYRLYRTAFYVRHHLLHLFPPAYYRTPHLLLGVPDNSAVAMTDGLGQAGDGYVITLKMAVINSYRRTVINFQIGVDGLVGAFLELEFTFIRNREPAQGDITVRALSIDEHEVSGLIFREMASYELVNVIFSCQVHLLEANNVSIDVKNNATTDATLRKGLEFELTGSSFCVVPTLVHTWSGIDVEDGAVVIARTGNVDLHSNATANSKSVISNSSVGIYFADDSKYPYSYVGQISSPVVMHMS